MEDFDKSWAVNFCAKGDCSILCLGGRAHGPKTLPFTLLLWVYRTLVT